MFHFFPLFLFLEQELKYHLVSIPYKFHIIKMLKDILELKQLFHFPYIYYYRFP